MNPAFWDGRRVFLTGHTGFKGSWLALWLKQMGAVVTGYALPPPTNPNLFEEARVAEGLRSVLGDVRDFTALKLALGESRAEVVFHLAAQPLVRASYHQPLETYATNVMGTVNLLEAVREAQGVRAVVNVTTDKCYENREWFWGYRENEPLGGYDPYSSSKACSELVTSAYRQSFFHPNAYATHRVALASARAGNVIGGGDWAQDRLIPDLLKGHSQGTPVMIRNPEAIRPWQHVLEPLRGYLRLAERLCLKEAEFMGAWNFGPGEQDAWSVGRVADHLASILETPGLWTRDGSPALHEASYLKLDISKARSLLGWAPELPLAEALGWVAQWHSGRALGEDVLSLTLGQIERYQQRVAEREERVS